MDLTHHLIPFLSPSVETNNLGSRVRCRSHKMAMTHKPIHWFSKPLCLKYVNYQDKIVACSLLQSTK